MLFMQKVLIHNEKLYFISQSDYYILNIVKV